MAGRPLHLTTIRQYQSETDLVCAAPLPKAVPVTTLVLIVALGLAGAATVFIPLDKTIVSSSARLVSTDQAIVIQALNPSLIQSIDVKEGQRVEKGQLLATLDPTLTQADLVQQKQVVAGLSAQIARAEAEENGRPFDPPLTPADPDSSYLALQKRLFDQRAAALAANVHSADEKISQAMATLVKLQGDISHYQDRLKISQQVEGMKNTLFKNGSDSQLNLLIANDARVELSRQLDESRNSLAETQHQIASSKADKDSTIRQWYLDTSSELVTARNNLDAAQATLDKASKLQDLIRLTAPEAGTVLTIAKRSVGSVLVQADQLFEITPSDTPIQAEVDVPSRDIGFVRVGDRVHLNIDAFDAVEHGHAEGKVAWISENAFTRDANNAPVPAYYKIRATVDDYRFRDMPTAFHLQPGMTLQADVTIGRRPLLYYLLGDPLMGGSESMRG